MRPMLALLLVFAPASGSDAVKAYLSDLRRRWADETISESRTVLVKELKKYDDPEAAEWLLTEVVGKEDAADVLRQALSILAGYRAPATVKAILDGFGGRLKDKERKLLALRAIGALPEAAAQQTVAQAFKQTDSRWLIAACDAAAAGKMPEHRPAIVGLFKHKSPTVRVAAVQAIGAMHAEAAIPDLFRLFASETSARVRYEAWLVLTLLLRDPTLPYDPNGWKAWYEERRETFKEAPENPYAAPFPIVKGEVAKPAWFFRIPVFADRICFVLDATGDMDGAWTIDIKAEQAKKEPEQTPGFFSVKTRWQLARAHLRRCLELLPSSTEVAFVFFTNKLSTFPEDRGRYLKNTQANRDKLFGFMDSGVERGGKTAMYEALAGGWGFLDGGNPDRNFNSGCDTIVFVTDGVPTEGEMKNRPEAIRAAAWRASLSPRLRIHCVGLHNHAYELLKGMAKDTGGLYVHAQEPDDPSEPQDLEFWPERKKAYEAAKKGKAKAG